MLSGFNQVGTNTTGHGHFSITGIISEKLWPVSNFFSSELFQQTIH